MKHLTLSNPFQILNSVVAIQLVHNPYFLMAQFFHQFHFLFSADLLTHLQENEVMYLTQKKTLSNQYHLGPTGFEISSVWRSSIQVPEGTGIATEVVQECRRGTPKFSIMVNSCTVLPA